MIYTGCHLSSAKGFEAMGKNALKLGADTFAFFTRNPRGGNAKAIDPADAARFRELAAKHHFGKIVAHAPYTLNPCGAKEEVRDFAFRAFQEDLVRMEYIPGNYYNFHPGSHVGQGAEKGIELIADLLNQSLKTEQTTTVLLETMAGKGTEVGRSFEELRAILDRVELKEKMGVCLDTCHVWDGGYDIVNHFNEALEEFGHWPELSQGHSQQRQPESPWRAQRPACKAGRGSYRPGGFPQDRLTSEASGAALYHGDAQR